MHTSRTDIVVIGAGIAGLSCAAAALARGRSVRVFERSPTPQGASIRNFGMIWPIGQPTGPMRDLALRSRELWLERADLAGFEARQSGSVHIATGEDEWHVLSEYASGPSNTTNAQLVPPGELPRLSDAIAHERVTGGLWNESELAVNPREALPALVAWLSEHHDCQIEPACHVATAEPGRVMTADGRCFEADAIVVCSGADGRTLFPHVFRESSVVPCKLHMMKTAKQPDAWRMGPHLAGGLTLRHYKAFEQCPSLPALRERVQRTMPEFETHGIHVMATQAASGEVIIGDSHEYGDDASCFDNADIDRLILAYLATFCVLPELSIAETWTGTYAKRTSGEPFLIQPVDDGIWVFNGLGGNGMTLAPALAEQVVEALNHPARPLPTAAGLP